VPSRCAQVRQGIALIGCGDLPIRAPVWTHAVHGVGSAHAVIDPPPLGIAGESWHAVGGAQLDLGAIRGRHESRDQVRVGRVAANIAVDPTVPRQLTGVADAVPGWRVAVILIGGKKSEAETELPKLRAALDARGAAFGAAQGWQEQGRQDGDNRDHDQEFDQGEGP